MAEAEQREALKNMTEAERRAWEGRAPQGAGGGAQEEMALPAEVLAQGRLLPGARKRPDPAASFA